MLINWCSVGMMLFVSTMLINWSSMNMLQVLELKRFCNASKIYFIYSKNSLQYYRSSFVIWGYITLFFFAFIWEYMQFSIKIVSRFLVTFFDTTFLLFFEPFPLLTPYDLFVAQVLVVDHASGDTMVGQSTQNIHKWHESEIFNK